MILAEFTGSNQWNLPEGLVEAEGVAAAAAASGVSIVDSAGGPTGAPAGEAAEAVGPLTAAQSITA